MSKYTTEVRFICQNWTDDPNATVDAIITNAIPHIFNDWWDLSDQDHKLELEKKILRHYYTQEIGYETVGLWKLHLNQTLSEIMPKYSVLYDNLAHVKAKLFETADWTEETEGNTTGHNESNSTSGSTSSSESTSHMTDNSTTHDASSSSNNADSTGSSEAWQKYNDTPQGRIDELDTDTYLTNATKNVSDSTGKNSSQTTADGTTTVSDTSDTSSTSKAKSDTTSNTAGDSTGSSNSTRHVSGKNSGGDYLSQYLNLQNQYNDIDQLVIADLQPLFMGLW